MPVQFEKWFRVDLSKKAMTEWVGSSFFTNDNLSNIIGVELYDGMDPVDVPGTIQGIIILPNDGTITVNGSRTGNKAWIELPSTALALDGMITITIRATISDRKVTLVQCSGRVNVTDTGMAIDPDDILPHDTSELMELIGDLRDVINEYTDIIMVQDTQPDTETNKLWLKKTTPDGVLVPTMEDLEEVGEEVSDLKSALTNLTTVVENINLIDSATIVDHSYCNGQTPVAGSYSRTALIGVKPSTAYTFANTESNYLESSNVRARFVCFYDASGTYISLVENTTSLTTPDQCAFVMISFKENARAVVLIEGTYDATTQTMVYVPYRANTLKVDSGEIADLSVENIVDYAVPGKNLFDQSTITPNSFLHTYPQVSTSGNSFVSDYIKVSANETYVISNDFIRGTDYSCRSYVLYDEKFQKVSSEHADAKNKVITPTVDGYLRFTGYINQLDRTQVELGDTPTAFEPFKKTLNNTALLNDEQIAQTNNILFRKKWAVCGDSFTNGSQGQVNITSGKYRGMKHVYPYIIGNRNEISVLKFFEGGRTLAFPAEPGTFANSLTNPNADWYYQNIPADVDYITIYLGINDEHHAPGSSGGDGEDHTGEIPIGTINDSTTATYLGAWNVVLTWLISNRPNAHIGIIVTNGNQSKDEYRQGQIAIAEKYGIPYIDLNGDSRTPAMIRTSNPNIPSAIKTALIQKWAVNPSTNTHPNDAAHEFESTFIENFLRSI